MSRRDNVINNSTLLKPSAGNVSRTRFSFCTLLKNDVNPNPHSSGLRYKSTIIIYLYCRICGWQILPELFRAIAQPSSTKKEVRYKIKEFAESGQSADTFQTITGHE